MAADDLTRRAHTGRMATWRMGFVGGPLDGETRDVEAVRHHDGWYPCEVFEMVDTKPWVPGDPSSTVLALERYKRVKMGRPRFERDHPLNELLVGYVYVHQSCLDDLAAVEAQALEVAAWGPHHAWSEAFRS